MGKNGQCNFLDNSVGLRFSQSINHLPVKCFYLQAEKCFEIFKGVAVCRFGIEQQIRLGAEKKLACRLRRLEIIGNDLRPLNNVSDRNVVLRISLFSDSYVSSSLIWLAMSVIFHFVRKKAFRAESLKPTPLVFQQMSN